MLDLARSRDRDDEGLLGQEPCQRQLRRRSVFSLRKLGDAIDEGFIRGYAFPPEPVKSRTEIRFRIKLRLCIKLLRQIGALVPAIYGASADENSLAPGDDR